MHQKEYTRRGDAEEQKNTLFRSNFLITKKSFRGSAQVRDNHPQAVDPHKRDAQALTYILANYFLLYLHALSP